MPLSLLRPLVLGLSTMLLVPLTGMAQDPTWLDGDMASWNSAGMAIPAAPDVDGNADPRCEERERPVETAADEALVAEGWRLYQAYQAGWDVTLVWGLAGYDGMCRPLEYQAFIFVDGDFAGTISPVPMNSRTDSAADSATLWFRDQVGAEFRRYTEDDALCCPSGTTSVEYTIEETPDGPVLNPVSPS